MSGLKQNASDALNLNWVHQLVPTLGDVYDGPRSAGGVWRVTAARLPVVFCVFPVADTCEERGIDWNKLEKTFPTFLEADAYCAAENEKAEEKMVQSLAPVKEPDLLEAGQWWGNPEKVNEWRYVRKTDPVLKYESLDELYDVRQEDWDKWVKSEGAVNITALVRAGLAAGDYGTLLKAAEEWWDRCEKAETENAGLQKYKTLFDTLLGSLEAMAPYDAEDRPAVEGLIDKIQEVNRLTKRLEEAEKRADEFAKLCDGLAPLSGRLLDAVNNYLAVDNGIPLRTMKWGRFPNAFILELLNGYEKREETAAKLAEERATTKDIHERVSGLQEKVKRLRERAIKAEVQLRKIRNEASTHLSALTNPAVDDTPEPEEE